MVNFVAIIATDSLAIFIGAKIPELLKQWHGPFKKADYSMHIAKQPNKLTLYGTTTCRFCAAARAHLRSAGIPFNDMIIDKSEAANKAYRQLQESSVPVLVSADRLVVGFDRDAYDQMGHIANKN